MTEPKIDEIQDGQTQDRQNQDGQNQDGQNQDGQNQDSQIQENPRCPNLRWPNPILAESKMAVIWPKNNFFAAKFFSIPKFFSPTNFFSCLTIYEQKVISPPICFPKFFPAAKHFSNLK